MYNIRKISFVSIVSLLSIATILVSFFVFILFVLNKVNGFYLSNPNAVLLFSIILFVIGLSCYILNMKYIKSFENNSILIKGKSLGFVEIRINRRSMPVLKFEYEYENKIYQSQNYVVNFKNLEKGSTLEILVKSNNPKKALVYSAYK